MKKTLLTTIVISTLMGVPYAYAIDMDPPTTPINVTATAISSSQISLSWTGSVDNVGVIGYTIVRCTGVCTPTGFGTLTGNTLTTYVDSGLSPGSTYSYRIRAYDAGGNISNYSPNTARATTLNPYSAWSGIIHYNSNKKIINRQLQTGQYFNALKRDVVLSSLIASSTVLSGSSSGNQTINDVVYDVFTGSTVRQLCTSIAAYATDGNFSTFPVTYGSQNESVATVDSTGAISYVGDGTTYFTVRYKNLTRAFPCAFLTSVGGTSYTFDSLLSTSLAQHLINTINTKISGLSPSATTQGLYSTRSAGTLTWVRNPDHFASTTDLTSAAVYNSSTGYTLTGALVAPDIMIHANHAHPSPGSTTYFVTSTSTVVSSVISSGTNIAGTDIWVSKLATPITYGVTPAKVIAKNSIGIYGSSVTGTKLTATALGYMPVPVVFIPQDSTVYIGTTNLFTSTLESVTTPYRACNSTDYTGTYGGWYRLIVGGDSATPAYFIINNEAVLLGTWNMPCAPSNVSNYVTEINAAMTSLGSAYQLTTVDLSGFPTY